MDVGAQLRDNQLVEVVRIGLPHRCCHSRHHVLDERAAVVRGAGRSSRSSVCIPVYLYSARSAGRFQAADEAEGDPFRPCAQENLTGVRVVRAFGREKLRNGPLLQKERTFAQPAGSASARLLAIYWGIRRPRLTCLQVMLIIVCGIVRRRARRDDRSASSSPSSPITDALPWPVRQLGRVLSDMSKAGVSDRPRRLHHILPRRRRDRPRPP
ncbi:MAG: hypothetical protein ACLU9S_12910 [Oscillospiraceae bacterium]